MNNLVQKELLTPNGKAAVIAALDPFHDNEITDLVGWPDYESAPSVVRRIVGSKTVTSVGEGSAITIMTYPTLQNMIACYCDRANNIVNTLTLATSTDTYYAPVVIRQYTSAQAVSGTGFGIQAGHYTQAFDMLTGVPEYCRAGYRPLGLGIEVHDVSAEIYKQGTITVSQIEQNSIGSEDLLVIRKLYDGGTDLLASTTPTMSRLVQNQYRDLSAAVLMPGSVQWEAKKGCYVVIPFTGHENSVRHASATTMHVTSALNAQAYNVTNPAAINTSTIFVSQPEIDGFTAGDNATFYLDLPVPMHSKNIMLTGLSAQSTFTINVVLYLEQFPATYEPGLLTLAKPSAPLDDLALEIISRSVQELPIAVPVGENPLGEWFSDVVATALEVISPIASIAFPEFAPLITGGSALAKRMLRPAQSTTGVKPGKALPSPKAPERKNKDKRRQIQTQIRQSKG